VTVFAPGVLQTRAIETGSKVGIAGKSLRKFFEDLNLKWLMWLSGIRLGVVGALHFVHRF